MPQISAPENWSRVMDNEDLSGLMSGIHKLEE